VATSFANALPPPLRLLRLLLRPMAAAPRVAARVEGFRPGGGSATVRPANHCARATVAAAASAAQLAAALKTARSCAVALRPRSSSLT
jgi:hypothetical protein